MPAPMRYLLISSAASCAFALGGCAAIPAGHAVIAAVAAQGTAATLALGAGAGAVVGLTAPEMHRALRGEQDGADAQAGGVPGTFGAFLATSDAEVRTLVQRAKHSQREVLVVAGVCVQQAIARGRAVFEGSLERNPGTLGAHEKAFKSEIEALVATLYAPADMTVKDAGERARAIGYALKPAGGVPLLSPTGPVFLFSSEPFQRIAISGNFPAAYAGEAVPQLALGARAYKAYDYSPDRLWFSVPTADLGADDQGPIAWKTGILSVPWISSGFLSSREAAKLNVEFALLPFTFGQMSIERTITTVKTEEKTQLSREFVLDATNPAGSNNQCLALSAQDVALGWRLRRGTSGFVPGSASLGAWKLSPVSESEQSVCWDASASSSSENAPGAARGGAATWRISATIFREVKELGSASEHHPLNWGSKYSFRYPAGSWKLRYSRKGLGVTELSAAETSHPFLRVSSDAAELTIRVYPF